MVQELLVVAVIVLHFDYLARPTWVIFAHEIIRHGFNDQLILRRLFETPIQEIVFKNIFSCFNISEKCDQFLLE